MVSLLVDCFSNDVFSVLYIERFDDDEGNAYNNNSSIGQKQLPIDDLIATSRIPIDFETAALKVMMSRYFRNRTRFKMAVRFVISHVR